jgi:hypothetical protein
MVKGGSNEAVMLRNMELLKLKIGKSVAINKNPYLAIRG